MRIQLLYLLLLTLWGSGFTQGGNDIDLGGESVITTMIPVKKNTDLDFRARWLGLQFGDLKVSQNITFGGLPINNPFLAYEEALDIHEYLEDQTIFYNFLMQGAYTSLFSDVKPTDKIFDTVQLSKRHPIVSVSPIERMQLNPDFFWEYVGSVEEWTQIYNEYDTLLRVDTISWYGEEVAMHLSLKENALPKLDTNSVAIVAKSRQPLDSAYWHKYQHTLALSKLLKTCIAEEESNSWGIYFNFEEHYGLPYSGGGERLRGLIYEWYVLLAEKLLQLSDEFPDAINTVTSANNSCSLIEGPTSSIMICERDIIAYADQLQSTQLSEEVIAEINKLSPKLQVLFGDVCRKFDEATQQYEALQPEMTDDEQAVLGLIIDHTSRFNKTYYQIQQELAKFKSFPRRKTSYWHVIQIADYLSLLEAAASKEWGRGTAQRLLKRLEANYISQVWQLQEEFLARKADD